MTKRALITGVTGQDGSYLAELLNEKGYEVHGLVRRTSSGLPETIEEMHVVKGITLHDGNLRDLPTVRRVMETVMPDEVYNLAAQSHVGVSFKCPDETMEINYYGVGRVVNEALTVNPDVRIYQASTSEMFGSTHPPQNEHSPFCPVSPYAKAKLRAHEDFIRGYRGSRGVFACSGILFNHESSRRGKAFLTRKVTYGLARIAHGLQSHLELGNMDAKRDWGYAPDYVRAMWMMLQTEAPDDFVIATGEMHTVREFIEVAARVIGMEIAWEGIGVDEIGRNIKSGQVVIKINPEFYRPVEVDLLQGDPTKAHDVLGWTPTVNFSRLVEIMAWSDISLIEKEA